MSGFTDSMIDDGYTNEQDYFDHLCEESFNYQYKSMCGYDPSTEDSNENGEKDISEDCASVEDNVISRNLTLIDYVNTVREIKIDEPILVNHSLFESNLQLMGFVVSDYHVNLTDFIVSNNKIKYNTCTDKGYFANNKLIYNRLVFDNFEKEYTRYFKIIDSQFYNSNLLYRSSYLYSGVKFSIANESSQIYFHPYNNGYTRGISELGIKELKFEFYLFCDNSDVPECATNELFALCKYIFNGEIKFGIFNFYELRVS